MQPMNSNICFYSKTPPNALRHYITKTFSKIDTLKIYEKNISLLIINTNTLSLLETEIICKLIEKKDSTLISILSKNPKILSQLCSQYNIWSYWPSEEAYVNEIDKINAFHFTKNKPLAIPPQDASTLSNSSIDKRLKRIKQKESKLKNSNMRMEVLQNTLTSINQVQSTSEIESCLIKSIHPFIPLKYCKISLISPSSVPHKQIKNKNTILSLPLKNNFNEFGTIIFSIQNRRSLNKTESLFLENISNGVALAIEKLHKLEQAEVLKSQWESTFNAILEPVSIINRQYELIQTNRAFAKFAGLQPRSTLGKKCYEVLFSRQSPCEGCRLAQQFQIKNQINNKILTHRVFSQKVEDNSLYINLYRDISQTLLLEKQILDSAKLAELGTIGGSIAHELNNPLAGITTFTQLIDMYLPENSSVGTDIKEIQNAAMKCRDIIDNLLIFTRKESPQRGPINLDEVLNRAIKITEFQSKPIGINITIKNTSLENTVYGSHQTLIQGFIYILYQCTENIALRELKDSIPFISITITRKKNHLIVYIQDNGHVFAKTSEELEKLKMGTESGLRFSISEQIFNDNKGHLNYYFNQNQKNIFKVQLYCPDF